MWVDRRIDVVVSQRFQYIAGILGAAPMGGQRR